MWTIVLKAIAANLLVLAAAFGFGSVISRLMPECFSRPARMLCAMVGGFGLLGLSVMLVGMIRLDRWTAGAVLLGGIILAARSELRPWTVRARFAKLPAAIVLAGLTVTAVGGLVEPAGDWGIDGVAYHLLMPKVWLRNGVIRPVADNMNTSYPNTPEVVFAAMWAFGGDRAPGFSAWWTMGLLLAAAAGLGRRCGTDVSGGWWIAALILFMPAVFNGGHSGFIDVIYATYILTALRIGLDATERKHFAAVGIFCGLAMATKYPALLATPLLILCAMWPQLKSKNWREAVPDGLLAGGVACLVAAPIYLRNWYFVGCPLYPPPASVSAWFHVKYFSAEASRAFYRYNVVRGSGHGRGFIHFFTLPFNLTYHTADFSGAGGIGLTPLAFGPLGVFTAWREPFARRLAAAAFLLTAIWFVTMQESRYLIHVYALSAMFAVIGWQKAVSLTGKRGKWLCAAVVALSLAYGAFMEGKVMGIGAMRFLSATGRRDTHLYGVAFVQAFDYINHDPAVTRVLILDRSVPPYFSDKDYVKPFGQWGEQVYPEIKTTADALAKMRELGVTHVMDVESTIAPYQVPPNYPGLELVFQTPRQRVFRVLPVERSRP